MKAIETMGTVDKDGRILLEHLPISTPMTVRVIVLAPETDDIEENDWIHALQGNPAFDFLKDLEEDLYSKTDGRPHHVA